MPFNFNFSRMTISVFLKEFCICLSLSTFFLFLKIYHTFQIFREFVRKNEIIGNCSWGKVIIGRPIHKTCKKKTGLDDQGISTERKCLFEYPLRFHGRGKMFQAFDPREIRKSKQHDARVTSFIRNITIHVRRSGSVGDFLADPPHTPRCVRLGLRAANNL